MYHRLLSVFPFFCVLLLQVLLPTSLLAQQGSPYLFPYDINYPDTTFVLEDKLREISGLSISGDGKKLYAVQDELGTIFILSTETGTILKEIPFWKKGDYEGIEVVEGGSTWVVKSNGKLYELIEQENTSRPHLVRYRTGLLDQLDIEGLGYDSEKQLLLLAAKGRPPEALTGKDSVRYIFLVNPQTGQLSQENPGYSIRLDAIQAYIEKNEPAAKEDTFKKFFKKDSADFNLGPSGVAVNPLDQSIYIISSVGKILIVLSKENEILHIVKLDKDVHAQPEGICFASDGTLYISNEGKNDQPPVFMKFKIR